MTDKTIPEEKLYNRFIEQPLKMDSQINYYLKALSVFVGRHPRDLRVQGNWIRRDTDFASGLPRQGNERHRLCQSHTMWMAKEQLFIYFAKINFNCLPWTRTCIHKLKAAATANGPHLSPPIRVSISLQVPIYFNPKREIVINKIHPPEWLVWEDQTANLMWMHNKLYYTNLCSSFNAIPDQFEGD